MIVSRRNSNAQRNVLRFTHRFLICTMAGLLCIGIPSIILYVFFIFIIRAPFRNGSRRGLLQNTVSYITLVFMEENYGAYAC
jgi:hypothetical protein